MYASFPEACYSLKTRQLLVDLTIYRFGSAMIKQPRIRRLAVTNFRGLASTVWYPNGKMNLLIGGGDSGKSTLLHAIALLFSPTNSAQVFETDYHNRSLEPGFSIEAAVSLPTEMELANFQQTLWPWEWNGTDVALPDPEQEGASNDPVYLMRVRGTPDLELIWEVVQPNMSPLLSQQVFVER